MALTALKEKLEHNGFSVSIFATGEEAAEYLNREIDHTTVGMGGSMTLAALGLRESLSSHNILYSHGFSPCDTAETQRLAANAHVYLLSANAVAEDTGALLNIDSNGNRVASSLYGHRKVYFVIGRNKLAPDFEQALWRARNIAAPKNAQRLKRSTPCAAKGDRCYDCSSPDRICRGLVVHYQRMHPMDMEVVLIDQDLGF